jgi:tetratricopeptide (TPR) repeat protein
VSKRNIWLLLLVVLSACSVETSNAQDGLKEAQELLKKQQWAKAQEAFDTLLETHPDNFDCRLGMAKAAYFAGDPGTGGFNAARAWKLKPKSAEAAEFVGRCFLAQGHNKRNAQGDPTGLYEQAAEAFAEATERNKNSADLWREYGSCLYWLGKNKEAAVAYESAFKADPKNADSAYWSGHFFHLTKQIKKAAEIFTASLCSRIPDSAVQRSVNGLWRCYGDDKNWDELLNNVAVWIKAKPKSETALWWQGNFLNYKADHKNAFNAWKKLEKVSTRLRPEAIHFQGVAKNAMGEQDEAIALFVKAASMQYGWTDQKHPGLSLHGIAGSLYGQRKFAEACKIGESKALPALRGNRRVSLQTDLGLFYRDFGNALEARSKNKEAQAAYVKSRDHYKGAVEGMVKYKKFTASWKAQVQNDFALMYQYHFDDTEKALENYKIALGYDSTNTDACLNYGRVMLRRGKFAEALRVAQQGQSRQDLSALISRIKSAMKK